MGKITTERYVTKSTSPSFVTVNDQFTVDISAGEVVRFLGDPQTLCCPIVKDGNPVMWWDFPSIEGYISLLEDALKVAAMEIAALRLVHDES